MGTVKPRGDEESAVILIEDEDEDHDGWGPIRPRRSSMPPDMHTTESQNRDALSIDAARVAQNPSRR